MPGRLHVDWVPDGTHAFKPADAAAYCAGAKDQQAGIVTPPPGMTSPASDLWARGFADAQAGKVDGACGMGRFGPELVPDPMFSRWADPTVPDGWLLINADANNYVEEGAPTGLRTVSDVSLPRPGVQRAGMTVVDSEYQIEWEYSAISGAMQLSGGLSQIMDSVAGVRETLILTSGPGNTFINVEAQSNVLTDTTLAYLSIRQLL